MVITAHEEADLTGPWGLKEATEVIVSVMEASLLSQVKSGPKHISLNTTLDVLAGETLLTDVGDRS